LGLLFKAGFRHFVLVYLQPERRENARNLQKGFVAERWFIDKNEDWILQEDNDPKHRSKLCTEWKQQSGIVILDWPSQSPDANPI